MGGQVGLYAQSMLGVHSHANAGQGGQLNPLASLNPQPVVDFGDGSDGDVTAAAVLLGRDMSYNNLRVTGFIRTDGFKIKVKGKLTIDGPAYIYTRRDPGDAGVAGVGGVGGDAAYAGRLPQTCLPTPGGKGGDGGVAGVIPSIGGVVPDSVFINAATLFEGRLWAGSGGGGGGSVGDGIQAGAASLRVLAGAKGGNGAAGIYVGPGVRAFGGGGGGGGGGFIEIWANEIDNAGQIHAMGGDGGAGAGDAIAQAGGGGGGGGGCILIYYKTEPGSGLGTITVTGGVGGASFGGAADGLPGAVGFVFSQKIGI